MTLSIPKQLTWSDDNNAETDATNSFPHESSTKTLSIDNMLDYIAQDVAYRRNTQKKDQSASNHSQCKKWSRQQTSLFFEVLQAQGPDFTLMATHINFAGKRSRKELRNKYRKESRLRDQKVQSALGLFFDGNKNPQ